MATLTLQKPRWVRSPHNTPPPLVNGCNEADSQTFVEGDLVYLNAGAVTACGADPAAIAGLACEPGTNVTSGNVEITILPIREGDYFVMNLYHATPASALQSGITIGTAYEIVNATVSGATAWCVDMANTTNERAIIMGLWTEDATSDLYGRVLVRFLNEADDGGTQRNNILQLNG